MNTLIRPTDKEDAAITTAALSDLDALPLTDTEWGKVRLSGSDFAQHIHKHFADLGVDELPIPARQVRQVRLNVLPCADEFSVSDNEAQKSQSAAYIGIADYTGNAIS